MKRVLITGSSRGIGAATARRLAADGWQVVLHGSQPSDALDEMARELGAEALVADLADPNGAEQLWRQASTKPLNALVNNAGIYLKLDFAGADDAEFNETYERIFQVNWWSALHLVRRASQHFIAQGEGKIVNVASRVGHRGEANASAYSASKAALINLTRALAVEHAKKNVQHYAIAPGWVETAMAREGMDDRLPQILADIPLGRMASPEDCAGAVRYLLSPEADYVSGIVIDLNGASYLR